MNSFFITLFFSWAALASVQAITLPPNCGHQSARPVSGGSSRIVGGQLSKTGEWPWQVYLNKSITLQGETITSDCGGALVNREYVLTAGHCVYDTVADGQLGMKFELEVIAGSVNIGDGSKRAAGEVRRKVAKV